MRQVADAIFVRDRLGGIQWHIWNRRRKSGIHLLAIEHRLRKIRECDIVRTPVLSEIGGIGETVCTGKLTVQTVEAPVFWINDYDVSDLAANGLGKYLESTGKRLRRSDRCQPTTGEQDYFNCATCFQTVSRPASV